MRSEDCARVWNCLIGIVEDREGRYEDVPRKYGVTVLLVNVEGSLAKEVLT